VLTPVSQDVLIGTTIAGRYQVLSFIGRGGMSVVYKARHNYMERIAAIKMLHAHLVSNQQSLKRFQQEAQAASCLAHPNVMGVHDFGITPQGQPYLVMDYLQGLSLSELIEKEGQLSPERTYSIFIQACDALSHAHQKGVIHRDLKPSNIMLLDGEDHPDFVKIVDFGIAKLLSQSEKQGQHLTQTGEVFGSPLYMSPEQCLADQLDARSDIYSLGCVIYETLTGKSPLSGASMLETMYMHLNEPPLPFRKVRPDLNLSEELETVVFRAMEKSPKDRQQSMAELRDELEAVRSAGKTKRSFLGLGHAPIRRKRDSRKQVKLSQRNMIIISALAVFTGAFATWTLLGSGNAPVGSSAYGPDSIWVSYTEGQPERLDKETEQKNEKIFKLFKMLREKTGGSNSPELVGIYARLAGLYRRQGRVTDAEEYYKKTYDGLKQGVSVDNLDFTEVAKQLAEVYCLNGKYPEAEQVALDGLQTSPPVWPGHPVFLLILSDCYYHQGKLAEAEKLLKEAVDAWTTTVLKDGPSAALANIDLAEVYRMQKNYKAAAEAYKTAEQLKEDELGQYNQELPRYLLNLAWLYEKSGDFAEAEPLYKKAWSISEKARGPKNPEISIILNRYSDLLWRTNRWLESIIFKIRALVMRG
jgi:serine/threonine protein kinase